MIKQARIKRYELFQEFLEKSNAMFSEIAEKDEGCQFYRDEYSLCIVPGGWRGGTDRRVLEVFFGARPYESYSDKPAVPRGESSAVAATTNGFYTERGARLVYGRTAQGTVNCTLIPAKTDGTKPFESAIMLTRGVDPDELLKGKLPLKHWQTFMSYMRVTSLDGDPGSADKMRVAFLRLVKLRYLDGEVTSPLWVVGARAILKWVFTVALSGALLTLITFYFSKNTVVLDSDATRLIQSLVKAEDELHASVDRSNAAIATLTSVAETNSSSQAHRTNSPQSEKLVKKPTVKESRQSSRVSAPIR